MAVMKQIYVDTFPEDLDRHIAPSQAIFQNGLLAWYIKLRCKDINYSFYLLALSQEILFLQIRRYLQSWAFYLKFFKMIRESNVTYIQVWT
jgi:hypothetical protein